MIVTRTKENLMKMLAEDIDVRTQCGECKGEGLKFDSYLCLLEYCPVCRGKGEIPAATAEDYVYALSDAEKAELAKMAEKERQSIELPKDFLEPLLGGGGYYRTEPPAEPQRCEWDGFNPFRVELFEDTHSGDAPTEMLADRAEARLKTRLMSTLRELPSCNFTGAAVELRFERTDYMVIARLVCPECNKKST
jgi:hypothetical protein